MRSTVGLPILIATLLLSNAICARSQTKGSFEVAAIKPGDPNNRQSGVHWQTGGRVANTNATLKALIAFAYGLSEEQILGGENWVGTDEYLIEAKPDSDTPLQSVTTSYGPMRSSAAWKRSCCRAWRRL